eukprot:6651482-Alexandrium_andersonii.AAC.1
MSACSPLRTPMPNLRHEGDVKTRPKPHSTQRHTSPFAGKTAGKRTANGRVGSAQTASRTRPTAS